MIFDDLTFKYIALVLVLFNFEEEYLDWGLPETLFLSRDRVAMAAPHVAIPADLRFASRS